MTIPLNKLEMAAFDEIAEYVFTFATTYKPEPKKLLDNSMKENIRFVEKSTRAPKLLLLRQRNCSIIRIEGKKAGQITQPPTLLSAVVCFVAEARVSY